jgi:L-asparaginase
MCRLTGPRDRVTISHEANMKKRVYIAYTGGTIGMARMPDGYAPAPGYLQEQMTRMPELASDLLPEFDIREYDPLLDSSDMGPGDWGKIAADIAAHDAQYDGFVVLHGTDTMAYTASALPFMLQELGKPVVLTGSQIPLCELRNDARANLITALLVAAHYAVPEVCLCFGQRLLRGCRATKVNAEGFDAFASPNFPPLGEVGVSLRVNWDLVLPRPATPQALQARPFGAATVGTLRLWPGISGDFVRNLLQPPLTGLVLEAYGMGNGPTGNREFLAAIEEATARGIVIVDCTQCLAGRVNLGDYATGSALYRAGVISGLDMTVEAALAKLMYLLGQDLPVAQVKALMTVNLRGELTPELSVREREGPDAGGGWYQGSGMTG